MIEVHQLTKRSGAKTAVEDLSFTVRAYDHPAPLHQVRALLDANAVHAGRSADHLRVMAATTGSVAVASRGSSTASACAKKHRSAR